MRLDPDVDHRPQPGRHRRSARRSRTWARASSAPRRRPNGTRFCVIDFPPGNHPHMHRTETIDYVIVIEGEIEMDMDDSTVKLKAGDIMIQRGTNHAWANRSGKPRARRLRAGRRASRSASASRSPARPARADEETSREEQHHAASQPNWRALAAALLALVAIAALRRRADLSERPGQADRADAGRRRHRHHGAHRRAAAERIAEPDRHRRQPAGRQLLGRRAGGGALAGRRADAAGGARLDRSPPTRICSASSPTTRQGIHADHRAVPRSRRCWWSTRRCRPRA